MSQDTVNSNADPDLPQPQPCVRSRRLRIVTGLLSATWLSTSETTIDGGSGPVIAEPRRSERNSSFVPAASVWRRTNCSSCNAAEAAHEALQGVQHACPVLDLSLELTSRSAYMERYPCKDQGKPAILESTT